MFDPLISETTRRRLAESLPVVESHRQVLVDRLQETLAAAEGDADPSGQAEITAMMLAEMLLAGARELVERTAPSDLRAAFLLHRSMRIEGRHYSRFADLLTPVMRDVLGPRLPREVAAAWCDAFWALVRKMQQESEARPPALEHR
jgi:hemoglobin-like flavoprotein